MYLFKKKWSQEHHTQKNCRDRIEGIAKANEMGWTIGRILYQKSSNTNDIQIFLTDCHFLNVSFSKIETKYIEIYESPICMACTCYGPDRFTCFFKAAWANGDRCRGKEECTQMIRKREIQDGKWFKNWNSDTGNQKKYSNTRIGFALFHCLSRIIKKT